MNIKEEIANLVRNHTVSEELENDIEALIIKVAIGAMIDSQVRDQIDKMIDIKE